ncbi:MAG: division/cell wall cluster transcriptional repressor MraZ [Flavobacteriales bacterium AspAUS03]
MFLIGTHRCKLDVKARLSLPSGLKKQLKMVWHQGFIIKRSLFQLCLELYPMEGWNAVIAKVNKLNRFVKKSNDFIRRLSAGVRLVEADNHGRIQIAKDLIAFAGIQKEVMISSSINMIEIWNKMRYEQTIEADKASFFELAEEVMGNLRDEASLS